MNEKGGNVCVVSLVQLNGGYISSIEQSRTAERFKEGVVVHRIFMPAELVVSL